MVGKIDNIDAKSVISSGMLMTEVDSVFQKYGLSSRMCGIKVGPRFDYATNAIADYIVTLDLKISYDFKDFLKHNPEPLLQEVDNVEGQQGTNPHSCECLPGLSLKEAQ